MGEAQLDSENHGDRDDTIINGGSTVSELIESLLGFLVRSGLMKFHRMLACPSKPCLISMLLCSEVGGLCLTGGDSWG